MCSCEHRFYFGFLPCGRGWIALLEKLFFLLLIKGVGSAKVLPPTDGVLVGVVLDLVPLVVLVVEHVRNHFMSSALFVCSGECIPLLFLSGTEAGRYAVLFLFGTEAVAGLCKILGYTSSPVQMSILYSLAQTH